MVENVTAITLTPDEIGTDLTTSKNQKIAANNFFSTAQFFKYGCNPMSVFTSSNCFTSTHTFFDPRYLSVVVAPSSSILTYRLTLENSNSNTIPSSCSGTVKANTYLLGESLGGRVS